MRVHIFGASGSGTSTLGAALAHALRLKWLDTDSYYWYPTDPPYRKKRPIAERLELLEQTFAAAPEGWVLSGAMESWCAPIQHYFDAAIFLYINAEERQKRLHLRALDRHGDKALPGGEYYEGEQEFQEWAKHYDSGHLGGRSLKRHRAFIEQLRCPVLELESDAPVEVLLQKAKTFLNK